MFIKELTGSSFGFRQLRERQARLESELCGEETEVLVSAHRHDFAAVAEEFFKAVNHEMGCWPFGEEVPGEDDTLDALAFEEILGQFLEFDAAAVYVSNDGGWQVHVGIFGQTPQLSLLDSTFLWLLVNCRLPILAVLGP